MPEEPEPRSRYAAFISYRHVEPDRDWAMWLHAGLEAYRVPTALVRSGTPRRIGRLFRDEEELAASADLSANIDKALNDSRFLIVVCSPKTPESRWVNQEVQRFRALGRGDRILALLVEGEPAQSFPPSLREIRRGLVDPSGALREVREDVEPLAADVRPRPDQGPRRAKKMALLRLAATVLGCRFDDLRRREHERTIRRLAYAVSVLAGLLIFAVGMAAIAYWQWSTAETRRFEAEIAEGQERRAKEAAEKARSLEREARLEAERQARLATAQRLPFDAQPILGKDPTRALLLAAEAALATARAGELVLPGAEQVLRLALEGIGGRGVGPWRTLGITPWLSPDGQRIVISASIESPDDPIRVIALARPDASPVPLAKSQSDVDVTAYSLDGRTVASIGDDAILHIWDLDEPARPPIEPPRPAGLVVSELTFDLDGKTLAGLDRSPAFGRVTPDSNRVVWVWSLEHPVATPAPFRVPGAVQSAAFGPDRRLAVADDSGEILIWDLTRPGAEPIRLRVPGSSTLLQVAFASAGRRLVAVSGDRLIRIWDLRLPEEPPVTLEGAAPKFLNPHPVNRAAAIISPDGQFVLTERFPGYFLWDLEALPAGKPCAMFDAAPARAVVFSPDGQHVALATASGLVVRRVKDGAHILITSGEGESGEYSLPTFSADGRRLAAVDRNAEVHVWRLDPGGAPHTILRGAGPLVRGLAFRPDGLGVVAVGDHPIPARLWALERPAASPLSASPGAAAQTILAVSPDGHRMLTTYQTTYLLWRLGDPADRPVALSGVEGDERRPSQWMFSYEGRRLIRGSQSPDRDSKVWDSDRPTAPPLAVGPGIALAVIPLPRDRLIIVDAAGRATLWDLTQQSKATFDRALPSGKALAALRADPEGRHLVSVDIRGEVLAWDLSEPAKPPRTLVRGQPQPLLTDMGSIPANLILANKIRLAFDPLGRRLIYHPGLLAPAHLVRLDAAAARPIELAESAVLGGTSLVFFSTEGRRVVSVGGDRIIRTWDVHHPAAKPIDLRGHEAPIVYGLPSPDGRRLATIDEGMTLRLWDLDQPRPESVAFGPRLAIRGAAFTGDGRWMVTSSNSGSVFYWPLNPLELIDLARVTAGRNLTVDEWRRHFPGLPYRPTFPSLPMPPFDSAHRDILRNLTPEQWERAFPSALFPKEPFRKLFPDLR